MVNPMVTEFQGEYRFLSNFWIEPDGTSVELEYQTAKYSDPTDRAKFSGLTPGQSKRLGGKGVIKLGGKLITVTSFRSDWPNESVRLGVMLELVRQKFLDHESLREKLLATGDQFLIEGNPHNDSFWGQCDGIGRNHLGRILMQVREELMGYDH